MAEIIKRYFEISGNQSQENRECWLFVVGRHDSGKSTLLKTFYESTTDSFKLEPAKSTFGYESAVVQLNMDTYVHIIEVNDSSSNNKVLINLLRLHPENSAIAVVFDLREPWNVQKDIDELLIPLFETPLSEFDQKLAIQYSNFLPTLWSDEPVALGKGVLSMNSGVPIFFVASHTDEFESFDDVKFDSHMRFIRESALTYAAGIGLSNSKSLISVIVSCILRTTLTKELREKIGNRTDYFLPPGWDSPARLQNIERIKVTNDKKDETVTEIKKAQEWQEFLTELQKVQQVQISASPSKVTPTATPVKASEPADDSGDFLSQFE